MTKVLYGAVLLSHLMLLTAGPSVGQLASLTRDINTQVEEHVSPNEVEVLHLDKIGQNLLMVLRHNRQGDNLWISDGTSEGTHQVTVDDGFGHLPGEFARGPNVSYWATVHGLLRTDGTLGGSQLVVPVDANGTEILASSGTVVGNSLFFVGRLDLESRLYELPENGMAQAISAPIDEPLIHRPVALKNGVALLTTNINENYQRLWSWTRSSGELRLLHEFARSTAVGCLSRFNGGVAFNASVGNADEFWVSDGTLEGTRPLEQFVAFSSSTSHGPGPCDAVQVEGKEAFWLAAKASQGVELWQMEGTTGTIRRLSSFAEPKPFGQRPSLLLERVNGRTVFWTTQPIVALWATPETGSNPTLLAEGENFSFPIAPFDPFMLKTGGQIYFLQPDGDGSLRLWASDGSPAGTEMISSFCTRGRCVQGPTLVDGIDGWVYYLGWDDNNRRQLWRSNAVADTTEQLTDLGEFDSLPFHEFQIEKIGNLLYFGADLDGIGSDLHVLNLTTHEIGLIQEFGFDSPASRPNSIVELAGKALFTACKGPDELLWASDGTREGTQALEGFVIQDQVCSPNPSESEIASDGRFAFFVGRTLDHNQSFFRTDGSTSGTVALSGLPHTASPKIAVHQGVGLIVADRDTIWRVDALQDQGTVLVQNPELRFSDVRAVNGRFFLLGSSEPTQVTRLWMSDGTSEGTDFFYEGPEPQFAFAPRKEAPIFRDSFWFIEPVGDRFLFVGDDSQAGRELWVTDGTLQGTSRLIDLTPGPQDSVIHQAVAMSTMTFFLAETGPDGPSLWRTDGTASGTMKLASFQRLPLFRFDTKMRATEQWVYFVADDGIHGMELWRTDGSVGGTAMVLDMVPGRNSDGPKWLRAYEDRLFFSAFEPNHGRELWVSGDFSETPQLVQDIFPGKASSNPTELTLTGERLFFSADDGFSGRELWSIDLAARGECQPSARYLCLQDNRFRVEASWRDFQSRIGEGTAVALSEDTGYFWFFNENNVETVVKVLDGNPLNGHFWTFFGALSNVEYAITVTDTQIGLTRRYYNPPRRFASVGDTESFGPNGAKNALAEASGTTGEPLLVDHYFDRSALKISCISTASQLCLTENRFTVSAEWEDFQGNTGQGMAVPLTSDTGYFWFFNDSNVELVLKVLDGRSLNDHFWVFYGALSNVAYRITVTDTKSGEVKIYENPARRFASVGDTRAFSSND